MIRIPALLLLLATSVACAPTPSAALQAPSCVTADAPVFLDGRGSASSLGPLERYRFDFGDGTPAVVGPNATQLHRYPLPGTYEATLTVTDERGHTGDTRKTLQVVQDVTQCTGEVVGHPRIEVSSCRTGGVLDCVVDFGSTLQGTTVTQVITITNVGDGPLRLTNVALEPSPGAFGLTPVADTVLEPGTGLQVEMSFNPYSAGRTGRKLFIPSNALNNPPGQDRVTVDLEGITAQTPFPRLEVTPRSCLFGDLDIDSLRTCTVTLLNTGTADVVVSGLSVTSDDGTMRLAPGTPLPLTLPPQQSAGVVVNFTPRDTVVSLGTLTISSNDNVRPSWDVALQGRGLDLPPVPFIHVAFINGQPITEADPPVQPLDDVVLSGERSRARRQGRVIAAYTWELIQKPENSRVVLTSTPASATVGFFFDAGGQPRAGLDVSGVYVVRLNVTDNAGLASVAPAIMTLNSSNSGRLHIELTWMDDHSDMDLHLVRNAPLNAFTTIDDCYYATCANGNQPPWSTNAAALPSLDVDNTNGFGPENITVQEPQPGTYLVGVHYFDGKGDPARGISSRVKVFVDGHTVLDETRVVIPCNTYWEVARVEWLGPTATVTASGTTTSVMQGGCLSQPPP